MTLSLTGAHEETDTQSNVIYFTCVHLACVTNHSIHTNTTKHNKTCNAHKHCHQTHTKTLTVLLSTLEWAGVGGGAAVVIVIAASVTCISVIHRKRKEKKKNSSENMTQRYMYVISS